jgi:signal transduction histidine kinase
VRALIVEREHRAAAERVVRDYAAIVADDLLRRIVFEFEMFGFRPVRSAMVQWLTEEKRLPTLEELTRGAYPQRRAAAALVDRMFLIDIAERTIVPPVSPAVDRWLLDNIESAIAERTRASAYQVIVTTIAGRDHYFVYSLALEKDRRIAAFTVREDELPRFAARAFAARNVLPGIVGNRRLENGDVFVRIHRAGFELLRTPGTFNVETGVDFPVKPPLHYMFGPARVEASIAPRAIPQLIVGGMPRPRVVSSILTLATTAAALVGAGWVRKREKQLERARLDFVAGVSHELRTPLTQIRMFAQTLLLNRVRSESERQKSLHIIDQETSRLTNLVDNLLFLARGERSDVALHKRPCDLGAVTTQAIHAYAPLADSHRVTLIPHVAGTVMGNADESAMKQVITNLLDNAVKYGPEGQTVKVSLVADNGHVRLTVDDEGPGIPVADRETIFTKFYRLDRDAGSHKAGSGIGLAVVRDIVERHEGKCWVERAPGGGARFVVEVPA